LDTVRDVKLDVDTKEYLKILVAFDWGLIPSPDWMHSSPLLREARLWHRLWFSLPLHASSPFSSRRVAHYCCLSLVCCRLGRQLQHFLFVRFFFSP